MSLPVRDEAVLSLRSFLVRQRELERLPQGLRHALAGDHRLEVALKRAVLPLNEQS